MRSDVRTSQLGEEQLGEEARALFSALFSSSAVVFWLLLMVHAIYEVCFGILSKQPRR